MSTLRIIAALMALAAASACGNKNKAAPTKPTTETIKIAEDEPEAAPEPAPEPVAEAAPAPGVDLNNVIYFEFDSSQLDDASREALNQNAEWLREDSSRELTIEGHTDEVGTSEYNLALGQRRANTAKEYLIRLGIAPDRIDIITYGEERPASSVPSENRRSVFVATK